MPRPEPAPRPTEPAPMPQQSGALVLDIRDLRTFFFTDAGVVRAVDGVSLGVRQGETLAIVGESGSGKSVTGLTVMRLFGRTPARVVGGTVRFRDRDGRDLDLIALPESEMRDIRGRDIAMIFQDPMSSLNPVFTVGDQIAEPLRIHKGLSRREAVAQAVELLRQVGISDPEARVSVYPHQLSGGMRQRVSIVRAFANDPEILLMDEPFSALDAQNKLLLQEELLRIWEEHKKTVLFITHSVDEAVILGDRIMIMTAHPGSVKALVPVTLPRPRNVLELQKDPEFGRLVHHIWSELRDEVQRARQQDEEKGAKK